jgi:hypothetical protein
MNLLITLIPVLKILTLSAVFFVWFIRYENIVKEFKKYNYSPKLRDLVGILKITAVLLIQTDSTLNVQIGSALLAFLMLAAFATHIKVKNPPIELAPSLILMFFSIIFFLYA